MENTASDEATNLHWSLPEIQELMQKGYEFMEQKESINACQEWLKVWHGLQEHISTDINSIEDIGDSLVGLHDACDWFLDFESELWNAGLDDKKYHYERIQYGEDFCSCFPDSPEDIIVTMQRAIADSAYEIGDIQKGEEIYQQLIKKYPDNVWGYIGWGDIYAFGVNNFIKADQEKARMIYGLALDKGMDDEKIISERLEELNS